MYNTTFSTNQIDNVRNTARSMVQSLRKERKCDALKVSTTNSKLNHLASDLGLAKTQVVAIDGLAGITCPFANICKAHVELNASGKATVVKGPECKFVCYAAAVEARYKNVRLAHEHNTAIVDHFSRIKDVFGLAHSILASIWAKSPTIMRKGGVVRWHASGDFHRKTYVEAAALVQYAAPEVTFFGYSKSPWVVQALTNGQNAAMVHSHGSKFDHIAVDKALPQAFVQCYAGQYDVPLACAHPTDTDDFSFIMAQRSFAINVH